MFNKNFLLGTKRILPKDVSCQYLASTKGNCNVNVTSALIASLLYPLFF